MSQEDDELLLPSEAAKFIRSGKSTLAKMRMEGSGPPFCRLGRSKIAYRKSDLRAYVEERLATSTMGRRAQGLKRT